MDLTHLSIISSESIAGFTDTKVVAKGVTRGGTCLMVTPTTLR